MTVHSPLAILQLVGHLHGVVRRFADERVVGHEEHGALDVWRLVLGSNSEISFGRSFPTEFQVYSILHFLEPFNTRI
jgi:hypothetical protein